MASCTITASSTVTAHLAKASVTSFSSSLVYIKRVLPVAMINIVFNRIDYENKFFTPHTIKETPYMTLRHGLPKKSELMSLYRQIHDALILMDKKCLDELYLIFLEKETNHVIEHYRFEIIYNPEDDGDMPTGVVVVEATSNLFQNINNLSKNNKIDWNGIEISMQLNLNNKVPSDYTSKQFEPSNPLISSTITEKYTDIGCILTGHHKMCLKAKGNIFSITDGNLVEERVENEVEENIPDEVLVEENKTQSSTNFFDMEQSKKDEMKIIKRKRKIKKIKKPKELLNAGNETSSSEMYIKQSRKTYRRKKEKFSNNKENDVESEINGPARKKRSIRRISSTDIEKEPTDNLSLILNDKENSKVVDQPSVLANDIKNMIKNVVFSDTNELPIKCTCNVNCKLDSIDLIKCKFCHTNQHVACNGYKKASSVPIPYVCHGCQPSSELEPVDVRMQLKKNHQKPFFALLRLLCLYYNAHKEVQMVIDNLRLLEKNDIIKRLTRSNVIYIDDSGKYTCYEAFVNDILGDTFSTQTQSKT